MRTVFFGTIELAKRFLVFALLAHVSHASATSLFEDSAVLEVDLTGPLATLIEEDDSKELSFSLSANDLVHSIKVRLRGNSRRVVCDFPPLRINFKVDDTAESIFENQDKLKLVTHCRNSNAAQMGLLMEYAAYRIFNLLSDVSYRVRLLHITYKDTDGRLKENIFERYGFLIEPASGLAEKVGGKPVQVAGVTLRSLDSQQAATVYIFQYLIGNTDWSLVMADGDDTCCHNGDLFDIESSRYYVPYDFDLSGLVNARYARPDPSLSISRVTQRQYRGYCTSADALRNALSAIKAQRFEILATIGRLPELAQKDVKAKTKYLDQFFDRANNEDKLVKEFERKCL